MNRNNVLAFVVLCGSCDAFWGYTKVPLLDGNCQVGGTTCKAYEACSEATEQCERQAPRVDNSSLRVIFSDGDEAVTLTGGYFAPDMEVLIDDQPVSMLTIKSAQELSFRTLPKNPALSFGSAPAALTLRSGDKVTSRSDLLSWSPSTATFTARRHGNVLNETPASSPANIQLGDINGDGRKDIVSRSVGSGKFYVALADTNGGYTPPTAATLTNPSVIPNHHILMDVNADGRLDLLYSASSSNTIYYSINNAGILGAQQTLKTLTGSSLFLGNADLTNDGKDDVAAIDYNSTNYSVLLANATGGLIPAGNAKTGSVSIVGNKVPLFGDVDKDGKIDMVVSPGGNLVTTYFGNNDGTFTAQRQVDTTTYNASVVALNDLDKDGYLDIIISLQTSANLIILKNTKNRDFARTDINSVSVNASIMTVSDINGDGRADILCLERGKANALGYAFMGRGDGTFGRGTRVLTTVYGPFDDERYVDIDGDGRVDIALIQYGVDAIYTVVTTSK